MPRSRSVRAFASLGAALTLAATGADSGADEDPRPGDYAYGWPIEQAAPGAFHGLDLSMEVYRSVADPELRDIGVYDASGRPVPRLIMKPTEPAAAPDSTAELELLPVYAPSGTPIAGMRLSLDRQSNGTSVRIETDGPTSVAAPRTLLAYVADLGETTDRLRAVEIEWPRDVEPVIAQISIEGSDDLEKWSRLGSGTVAGLRQGEAVIERHRVVVASAKIRYLRISWQKVPDGWRLDRLRGRFSSSVPAAERAWLMAWPTGRDADDGGHLYDIGGWPTIDRLKLQLPDENDLVRVAIFAWEPFGKRWERVHNGMFYRLRHNGAVVTSDAVAVVPRRAARWKVVIERGQPDSRIGLSLGWRPDRLMFLARGEGPWQLVAGSASDAANDFPQARRYSDPDMRKVLETTGSAGSAKLGARAELGGTSRLATANRATWKLWILWLGLVAGVLLVGAMVWRLVRQPGQE